MEDEGGIPTPPPTSPNRRRRLTFTGSRPETRDVTSFHFSMGDEPFVWRAGQFLEKWGVSSAPRMQGPYVRADGTLAVETRREPRTVELCLTEALPRIPLGRDLSQLVRPEHRFEPLASLEATPELAECLGGLLGKRLPWAPT